MGSSMPRKRSKVNIKDKPKLRPSSSHEYDSIETETPVSSAPKKENRNDGENGGKISEPPPQTELELSPTRRSPRLCAQRSRLIPKYSLPLVQSPPLPVRDSRPLPSQPPPILPTLRPALPITSRQSQPKPDLSPSERTASYYTALSSPINSTPALPSSAKSPVATNRQPDVTETVHAVVIKEIPSSLPWERSPSDGIGDAWPSSQSESSPLRSSQRSSFQRSQPRFEDGFRVPDPPSSKMSQMNLGETQSQESEPHSRSQMSLGSTQSQESQPDVRASQNSQRHISNHPSTALDDTQSQEDPSLYPTSSPKASTYSRQVSTFRIPHVPATSRQGAGNPQELMHDESHHHQLDAARKRKRTDTFNEMHDSEPESRSQVSRSPKRMYLPDLPVDEACMLLAESQIPRSMRKKSPEYIIIHSTQSQTQEYHPPPGPRPTSQDLDKPFGAAHTDSDESSSSMSQPPAHNWDSSQVTASPVGPPIDLSSYANPPSQFDLSSQFDEPPAMTVDSLPGRKASDHLSELDRRKE